MNGRPFSIRKGRVSYAPMQGGHWIEENPLFLTLHSTEGVGFQQVPPLKEAIRPYKVECHWTLRRESRRARTEAVPHSVTYSTNSVAKGACTANQNWMLVAFACNHKQLHPNMHQLVQRQAGIHALEKAHHHQSFHDPWATGTLFLCTTNSPNPGSDPHPLRETAVLALGFPFSKAAVALLPTSISYGSLTGAGCPIAVVQGRTCA